MGGKSQRNLHDVASRDQTQIFLKPPRGIHRESTSKSSLKTVQPHGMIPPFEVRWHTSLIKEVS